MVSKVLTLSRFSFKVRMKRSATPLPSGSRTKEGDASIAVPTGLAPSPCHHMSSWAGEGLRERHRLCSVMLSRAI
jgi:hypothetical protein